MDRSCSANGYEEAGCYNGARGRTIGAGRMRIESDSVEQSESDIHAESGRLQQVLLRMGNGQRETNNSHSKGWLSRN